MKYRSLENIIKDIANGYRHQSSVTTLEHSIRDIMERKGHYVETDPNDQITVGTYKTKGFEQSAEAQKLYSSLPKDTDPKAAETSAILHDKLFDIHKSVMAKNRSTSSDQSTAQDLINKIKSIAIQMKMEKEHGYLDRVMHDINQHLEPSGVTVDAKSFDIDDVQHLFASPSKTQTKEKQDRDIDNSKFLITRSIKAQRKLKIIDAD